MNLEDTKRQVEGYVNNFNAEYGRFVSGEAELEPLEAIYHKSALSENRGGRKILFWRGQGLAVSSMQYELIIAVSLMQRNIDVEFVLCDGLLSGCLERSFDEDGCDVKSVANWPDKCAHCYCRSTSRFATAGIKYRGMSKWVPLQRRAELRYLADSIDTADIEDYQMYGIAVGKDALSGAVRYYKGIDMLEKIGADNEKTVREYFFSSLVSTEAAKGAVDKINPDHVVMSHGIYPLWSAAHSYSLSKGIPVTRWGRAFRKDHIFLRTSRNNNKQHVHYPNASHWDSIKDKPLTNSELSSLDMYIKDRLTSSCSGDGSNLFDSSPLSAEVLRDRLNLPSDKQVWMIATHLSWDASLAYDDSLFRDMMQWLIETFRVARENKNVIWLIRVHPGEKTRGIVKGCMETICEVFGEIPDNIRAISSDSDINTYGLLLFVNGCITIRGTLGMETAMLGKPAILAGACHYSSRGFTYDPNTKEQYLDLLRNVHNIGTLSHEQTTLARRYAYDVFIRRQIPFFDILSNSGNKFEMSDFSELIDSPIMDMICSRIFDSGQFALDRRDIAERTNKEAMLFFSAGQYDKAYQKFDSAARYDCSFADPYYNKGVVCYHMGDTESAVKFFRQALEVSPDNKSYADAYSRAVQLNEWIGKGQELFGSGNCDHAEKVFREIIKVAPNHGIARNCLGIVLWRTGRNNDALAEFGNAIKLLPDNREVVWTVGQFLWLMGRANDAAALYCSYIQRHRDEKEMVQTVLQWQAKLQQGVGSELQNLNSSPLNSSGKVLQVTR